MKQHAIGVRFHAAADTKEKPDRFLRFYVALIEEQLLCGDYTKAQRCEILEEMIAICKTESGRA